jgi:hypothetical protein
MKYNPAIVSGYWQAAGIPEPFAEWRFHPVRKWRFDWAWPEHRLYLEADGGIWIAGGHNRGAQMKKDWEKRNAATILGWRGLWLEPRDLCTDDTVRLILAALGKTAYRMTTLPGGTYTDCVATTGCKVTTETR